MHVAGKHLFFMTLVFAVCEKNESAWRCVGVSMVSIYNLDVVCLHKCMCHGNSFYMTWGSYVLEVGLLQCSLQANSVPHQKMAKNLCSITFVSLTALARQSFVKHFLMTFVSCAFMPLWGIMPLFFSFPLLSLLLAYCATFLFLSHRPSYC